MKSEIDAMGQSPSGASLARADGSRRGLRILAPSRCLIVVAFALAACGGEDPGGGALSDSGVLVDTGRLPRAEAGVPAPDATDPITRDTGIEMRRDAEVQMDADVGQPDAEPVNDAGFVDVGPNVNNPTNPNTDSDCDGLSDAYEFATVHADGLKTDVSDPDSDGDGIVDGIELGVTSSVAMSGCPPLADADPSTTTLPTAVDSDGDGISDGLEDANQNGAVDALELDPRRPDSDGDGLPDRLEDRNLNGRREANETHGALRDTEMDGIADGVEDRNRDGVRQDDESDPLLTDTDADGLLDGDEDTNFNGVPEAFETVAFDPDTDCDGLSDGEEVNTHRTSPLVADTDGDGITDGVELGVTSSVAGSRCVLPVPIDADPSTTTNPLDIDSDADGVPDGVEDANLNGRVDAGELDPLDADTDDDMLSDGDELRLGFDPLDPTDPPSNQTNGLTTVCANNNLKVVDFDANSTWTLATETTMAYAPVTVTAAASNVDVAALDSSNGIAGFVLRMPLLGGAPATSAAQVAALIGRATAGASGFSLTWSPRLSGRNITSHDGYEASVSNVIEVGVTTGTPNAAELRNRLVALLTGLNATDFTGLPTTTGSTATAFIVNLELLVRTQPQEALLVGAVLPAADYDLRTDNRSIEMNDLTNGTSLAEAGARRDKDCDPIVSSGAPKADIIWMADISGSTDDDRNNIADAATTIVSSLTGNSIDFRLGVVRHTENEPRLGANNGGTLFGAGFVTSTSLFVSYLRDTSGYDDGCEFGLSAVRDAIDRALPRTPVGADDPRRIRGDATVAVVYISDEYAQEITMQSGQDCFGYNPSCNTGIGDYYEANVDTVCRVQPSTAQQACIDSVVQPFIDQLRSPQVDGVAFAQVISGRCGAHELQRLRLSASATAGAGPAARQRTGPGLHRGRQRDSGRLLYAVQPQSRGRADVDRGCGFRGGLRVSAVRRPDQFDDSRRRGAGRWHGDRSGRDRLARQGPRLRLRPRGQRNLLPRNHQPTQPERPGRHQLSKLAAPGEPVSAVYSGQGL